MRAPLAGLAVLLALLAVAAPAWPAAPEAAGATDEDNPRVTPVVRAYRKAGPAVVNIATTKPAPRRRLFGDDLLDRFFRAPSQRGRSVQSLGSGFLISPHGYVVTNAHVVRQAQSVTVVLPDGGTREAETISADPEHDLAVVKIGDPPEGGFAYLPLGRSDDLMVGETVIAVGNPLGLANTLTTGVISAVGREVSFGRGRRAGGLIQTDAPINPGNSGGPLLNITGELIGINTAIRADAENIGFAIPIGRLEEEMAHLLDFERINRVVFGARARPGPDGVEIAEVLEGTPAAGRLRPGDRVLAVNGEPVRQITDYTCAMLQCDAPGAVRFRVVRGEAELDVPVTLAAQSKPDGDALAWRLLGVRLLELTPERARDLNVPTDRGLMVVALDEAGPAARVGLHVRDVVFQIDRYYVGDIDAVGTVLRDVEPGRQVVVGILRRDARGWGRLTTRSDAPEGERL